MESFRIGDFVSLNNREKYQTDNSLSKNVNVFEITDIAPDFIKVKYSDSKIPFSEVKPIPINGKDDLKIYYDPIIAASIIGHNAPIPVHDKDYTYYYKSFEKHRLESKNYQELINDQGLEYVHEIQHFLLDKFNDKGLKINY
jgi:hypothetical protein